MDGDLADAIVDLKEEDAVRIAREALDAGAPPADVLVRGQAAMVRVGERFEAGTYFLGELIYAGAIFKRVSALIEQATAQSGARAAESKGLVVIGTVQGDVHDLGKGIVVMLLRAAGYEVLDLGIEVPPERFVEEVQRTGSRVLGMSALLTTSFPPMKRVVELLSASDLREKTHVMIGGGVVDESSRAYVGADSQSRNAYDAVRFCDTVYGPTA